MHWCWPKLCHHNSRRVVSIMQHATKTIWFREEINKRGIKLKIETSEQLEDMFTKVLAKPTFAYL